MAGGFCTHMCSKKNRLNFRGGKGCGRHTWNKETPMMYGYMGPRDDRNCFTYHCVRRLAPALTRWSQDSDVCDVLVSISAESGQLGFRSILLARESLLLLGHTILVQPRGFDTARPADFIEARPLRRNSESALSSYTAPRPCDRRTDRRPTRCLT